MKFKKLFSAAISAIIMVSCFSALNVNAEEFIFENPILKTMDYKITPDGKYIYNILDDGNIEIVRYTGKNSPLQVPSEIDGKTVTTIGYMNIDSDGTLCGGINSGNVVGAFENCSVWDIELPNTITKIDDYAFAYSKYLYNIKFSKNLTDIGEFAFFKCENLEKIVFPDKLKKIDDYAFGDCENLKDITIPKSVKNMDSCCIGYTKTAICGPVDYSKKIDEVQINCYKGTAGEKYAKENGFNYEYLDAPAHDHRYVEKIIKKPTYTSTGLKTYTCSICKSFSSEVIPKLELGVISGFKVKSVSSSKVKLIWDKVKDADGYIVYRYNTAKKTWVRIAKGKYNGTYTVKKLKAGTNYRFAVKPYKTINKKEIASSQYLQLSTSTKPATVNFKLTAGRKKAAVKWNKVNGASGYKVYYKTSKNGKWILLKTTNNKTTSYTKTGLKKGKTYYFTVKAYKILNGKVYNGNYTTKLVKIK